MGDGDSDVLMFLGPAGWARRLTLDIGEGAPGVLKAGLGSPQNWARF